MSNKHLNPLDSIGVGSNEGLDPMLQKAFLAFLAIGFLKRYSAGETRNVGQTFKTTGVVLMM